MVVAAPPPPTRAQFCHAIFDGRGRAEWVRVCAAPDTVTDRVPAEMPAAMAITRTV